MGDYCRGTPACVRRGTPPLNINWYALAQAGKHEHGARLHAPFDEESLARAITDGVDPDGNALDSTMPRYKMSDEDMAEYEGDEGDYITVEALLSSTLMTEDGDTVCSALVNIGRQLEMQNKIMVKLLTTLQKRA